MSEGTLPKFVTSSAFDKGEAEFSNKTLSINFASILSTGSSEVPNNQLTKT